MALSDELRAAEDARPSKCSVCRWLNGLPSKEAQEWDAAFADTHSYSNSTFLAVFRARKVELTDGMVKNHRANGHRQSNGR